jgi:hypothetical protein
MGFYLQNSGFSLLSSCVGAIVVGVLLTLETKSKVVFGNIGDVTLHNVRITT